MTDSNPIKILIVTHGATATGFSRVADGIIAHLKHQYEFYQFATNHRADTIEGEWPIYGNPDEMDAYGLDRLTQLHNSIKPQIILIINDLWFCCMHINRLKLLEKVKLIAYCPIDGQLTRPEIYKALQSYDQIVAYNHFGLKELSKVLSSNDNKCGFDKNSIDVIGHGVDHGHFYPLDKDHNKNKKMARALLFGNVYDPDDFIILNAAKHQARKRIDLTIKAFALFAKGKPKNVKLYLHTGATFDGPDLRRIIQEENIQDRVMTTQGWLDNHPAIALDQLNLLYNACDVGVNSSMGEGWGLISFEHAATGAAQCIPDHTACAELWSDIDTIIPIERSMEHKGLAMLWEEISIDGLAQLFEKLYVDKKFRQQQSEKAYANAHKPAYHWTHIAQQWHSVFTKMLT